MKVAFDVDYTLVGEHYEPIYDNIWLFLWFQRHGHDMIIWSGGGVDYATYWAKKLGLKARIIEKCSESVDIAVDDAMPLGEGWRNMLQAKVVIKV
jgi:hypothetical protein